MEKELESWLGLGLEEMRSALQESFGPMQDLGGVLRRRHEGSPSVLLVGHYDVVESGAQVKRTGDRLYGTGAADMKGGLMVLREAWQQIPEIGWEILLVHDEERGSPESRSLLLESATRHDYGLVFEPALPGGNLVGERASSATYRLDVVGRAAHVGRDFEAGESAIHRLAHLIEELVQMEGIVNVGTIEGGLAPNVVAEQASCLINVRGFGEELAVRERIEQLGGQLLSERPMKPMTPELEQLLQLVQRCGEEMGLDLQTERSYGVCDGNLLGSAGLPTVDTMGVRGGGMHTADEYMEVASLTERVELTSRVLKEIYEKAHR